MDDDDLWLVENFKLYEPHQDDYTVIEVESRGVRRPMSDP